MNKILIDSVGFETRAAILEKGRLRSLEIERANALSLAGNIYKARVARVLNGLNAAFLNIGESREAFLPLTDLRDELDFDDDIDEEPDAGKAAASSRRLKVKAGDYVLVQLVKDAIGNKGPKVTANNISLAGHLIVFLPYHRRKGVSRRISEPAERERLLKIAGEVFPADSGFIIRTVARQCKDKVLQQEARDLLEAWQAINRDYRAKKGPALLHAELRLPLKTMRDYFSEEVEEVIVDCPVTAKLCRQYLDRYQVNGRLVAHYKDKKPLFTSYGVEEEIKKALSRRVPLEGGGHLVIEETEALCAIDVNSGRIGGDDYRSMVLKANLLAAQEIAWQLRLRNLGGIIVIDFIDMGNQKDRRRVFEAFEKALEPDKARIKTLRISRFGLVQMTRQRTRESLRDYLADDCPTCGGQGVIRSAATVAALMRRDIQLRYPLVRRLFGRGVSTRRIEIKVSPVLEAYVKENLNHLFPERAYRGRIQLVRDTALGPDEFQIA